ncbi:Aspartate-semialdehyde dehydrogenase [Durusdinium trenchii]|uniref:Aspartate-semialdehyde dehydrogenase n=1 Tax=Durusdinium trenchii TaxID=1381693 RepID=A0ABP0QMP1_9DINO
MEPVSNHRRNPGEAPVGEAPELLLKDALEMQELLIAGYRKASFQAALHRRWAAAAGDALLEAKARQEVCAQVQFPILRRFGFEASRRGLARSLVAFRPLNGVAEVAERNAQMHVLVNPHLQDEDFAKNLQLLGFNLEMPSVIMS